MSGPVTLAGRVAVFNQPAELIHYLQPLVAGREQARVLDIGSGPFSTIGSYLPGLDLSIEHADAQDFSKFWRRRGLSPAIAVARQNMEALTYADDTFDVVHCFNALDHTRDALAAVHEFIRVCKPGGWIYIACTPDQLATGYKLHFWNAKPDGAFTNGRKSFFLPSLGFGIQFIDWGGSPQQNLMIATLRKENP